MSYREENGQVVLTMSREDYQRVLTIFGVTSPVMPKMMWGWDIEEIKSAMRQFQTKHPGKLPSEIERAA